MIHMRIETMFLAAAVSLAAEAVADCRPETWFHIIGGNASKAGLTADLEALRGAGFGGIQLFHGQYGEAGAWDGVAEQIPCLSAKWDDLMKHAADECTRLGMTFKMQNCPGWSMSGGPWIAPSNAMRKLVYARRDVVECVIHNEPNGGVGSRRPTIPELPVPAEFRDADSDWHDICYVAFPTPLGSAADEDVRIPSAVETNGDVRIVHFVEPVTIRTLELPSSRQLSGPWPYNLDLRITLEAETTKGWRTVCDVQYPQGCWQDMVPFSLACTEATAKAWRLSLSSPHEIAVPFVKFLSGARLDNWEGLAGHILRGQLKRSYPKQNASAYIQAGAVRVVRPGEALPACSAADSGGVETRRPTMWTVLRIGHVNMKKVNAPAPKEATGWECDKLDPRGIEANFAGYIGRLADGPLKGGKLKGMIVDSWECERQTWTWRMEEWFREANGYDVKEILPAVFGWVIGSPAETEKKLLDWRRTVSDLVTKNYYGRMAELAHAKGLTVAYETALGDVVPGDILEYWKFCDTPMCEFWQPYTLNGGFVGHPNFKPVRPCVSAAHIYGKRRIDSESFTTMSLTWDENFRDLKEQAVRHFARGVTHLVFHTYTHNPQTDGRVPGTSFGSYIGTPFIRGQTWWPFMRPFTEWAAECCAFLERGLPVIDVLRYLGDELDHKPDELEYFPEGFKNDYLNADVLFNRLDVKDGRFVLYGGMSYSAIWVPDSVMILPKTRARLDALAAKGGRVVYGSADEAVRGLKPQIASDSPLLWYHRADGDADCFFVAADEKGYSGEATFMTQRGDKRLTLRLAPFETRLLEFSPMGLACLTGLTELAGLEEKEGATVTNWTLSFPPGWGAPEKMALDRLVPWKDLPGVSEEGRSFSGTATYTTTVNLAAKPKGALLLDLGDVRDFARVFVNGREVAALWAKPYSSDIAPFVREGANEIKIEVTSTWFNRLAYDYGQPSGKRKTWTVWEMQGNPPPCLRPHAKLRDSGLLGPVSLICRKLTGGER